MATYYSNDFRAGLKIMMDGEPYAVEASEFVKPGKGQAFARVKLRRLLTGTRVEKTFKSTDSAEGADVVDMNLTYLYNDGEFWHFMNNETFEQLSADAKAIGDNAKWLLDRLSASLPCGTVSLSLSRRRTSLNWKSLKPIQV